MKVESSMINGTRIMMFRPGSSACSFPRFAPSAPRRFSPTIRISLSRKFLTTGFNTMDVSVYHNWLYIINWPEIERMDMDQYYSSIATTGDNPGASVR
jgi:hypothetical protein